VLTKEENELITRIGPGTPCGELLRRYWHPVFIAHELTPEKPKARIKILGEELVIFRGEDGQYGLVGEHCSHRGTSLYYGFLEGNCIRCPYHGWLYDTQGHCVEQPFEPQQSLMKHTLRHTAYPVQELAGLLWAYMGPPDKQPVLPHWDLLVRGDGTREWEVHPTLNCNWVQCEENTGDVTHTFFLHSYSFKRQGMEDQSGFGRPFYEFGFQPFEWGLVKSWTYGGQRAGSGWGNLLVFPNMLRLANQMHWRVPVDDTHTRIFWLNFYATKDGSGPESDAPQFKYEGEWLDEKGEYSMTSFASQDTMAWETQGPIWDRSREHLGASDAGVVWFRETVRDQIERVQRGEEPMGMVKDRADGYVDLTPWFSDADRWFPGKDAVRPLPGKGIFNSRHTQVEVPEGTARTGIQA